MGIHQEAVIDAPPGRVYAVLTDGAEFGAATGLPARIGERAGDSFSLFGGRVEGRQIELRPGDRVVQAWRFGSEHPNEWDEGIYSIVRFTLVPEGDGTRFVLDHDGIPPEWEDHIAGAYPSFYAEPLARYLAGESKGESR